MAISNEALCIGYGAGHTARVQATDGNVARLEHILHRRGHDHRHRVDPRPFDLHRLDDEFDELSIRFEPDQGALWCLFNHTERPCFTPRFLHQILTLQSRLKHGLAGAAALGDDMPLRTMVWGSSFPGIWNLGGDLELFTRLIRARAADELRSYAYACVDAVYKNLTIAERDSRMGLPEVLFNLFPGMGAYSLLCRRLDGVRAQQLILSGRVYEAQELEELGLVDLVVGKGEGPAAVREYLERNRRRHGTLLALSRVRQRCQPVTYEDLIDVTEIWVETALGLGEADLRRMEHLVRAQLRRHARSQPARLPPLVAVG